MSKKTATRNVLVSGIPRSGTTLAAALIDSMPDCVCLSEPHWQWHKSTGGPLDIGPDPDGTHFARWLVGDFVRIRRQLLRGVPVMDRRTEKGDAITNYLKARHESQIIEHVGGFAPFTRPGLSEEFTLAIKHNGPYLTALKPILDLHWFTVIAIVRNPVDVIHSWRSLDLPVSHGKMHDAARCWPEMEAATRDHLDTLQRQVMIYDLICERLYALRDQIAILTYERMIAEPELVAQAIGAPRMPNLKLIERNPRAIPSDQRETIISAVKLHGKHFFHFYPDIET